MGMQEPTGFSLNSGLNEKKRTSLYDPETYDIMLRTIYTILKHKYEPLIENQFKLYMKMNNTFMKFMENRGIRVPASKSLVYINTTLTWFSRSLDKIEDIYKMFAIIISCPLNGIFLLLIHYFDEVEQKINIKLERKEIMKELFKLEKEFLKIENSEKKQPGKAKRGLALALT